MIEAFARKARQVAGDPVLRRWLVGRALGRVPGPPAFEPHRPPYLRDLLPLAAEKPSQLPDFGAVAEGTPDGTLELTLPGRRITLHPASPGRLFEEAFGDVETLLAVHRFAWLPLQGAAVDPRWVAALWRSWCQRHANPDGSWAWHPYTAAERAINILDAAARQGWPAPAGETAALLARHAPAIAERLEYFGDHHTSNHLSNNGRGLYRLGLALGLPQAAEAGMRILLAEAARIFSPSGVLREGSTHYHLLLARNYADAWLAARAHRRAEAADLEVVARRAFSVMPHFDLPGGLPLVGDISPDAPPDFLRGLLPGHDLAGGWTGNLSPENRSAVSELRDSQAAAEAETLQRDGWLRFDSGSWAGLWHAPPNGWSFMPGHGHQDTGGFELHHGSTAVFVDPGRGAYGEAGDAALYRSAGMHSTLTVDGADPYPPNRPYYNDAFRARVGGSPPALYRAASGVRVEHHGFGRLRDVGTVRRQWQFDDRAMRIEDTVAGSGRHRVRRALLTPLGVTVDGPTARLRGDGVTLTLKADSPLRVEPVTRWRAYGSGEPASLIVAETAADLPWSGSIAMAVEST